MSDTMERDGFSIVTRHIVMEKDLNAFGNLFGGAMLGWLDEASALYVMDQIGYADFVTVNLDDVNFKAPGKRGDAIVIYCRTMKMGKSSITVQTRALAHAPVTGVKTEIITCAITFVCLKDGKPHAYFDSPAYKSWKERSEV